MARKAATAVPENPAPQVPEIDVSKMSIYEKLLRVRLDFYASGAKKTGRNLHAEFTYFELSDIVPIAEALFAKYRLMMLTEFSRDNAIANVIDLDNLGDDLVFKIPFLQIAEPAKFRMNEVQGMGAAVTYYRRYLYQLVLDLVEVDQIDSARQPLPPQKPVITVPKVGAPTAEKREEIKETLTATDAPADELQIEGLREALNALLDKDPEQEEWVQSLVLQTEGFAKLTREDCDTLIGHIRELIAEMGDAE